MEKGAFKVPILTSLTLTFGIDVGHTYNGSDVTA